ncbi:endoglucanase [Phakopsora pachyrhizi]|nr:endoglucanase [Phakopsora pachyrhizi]
MSWANGNSQTSSFGADKLENDLTLYNNVFEASLTSVGSTQSVQFINFQPETQSFSWRTTFSLKSSSADNDNKVKSYSNLCLKQKENPQIKGLKNFYTYWNWSLDQMSDGTVADVAYDIFTSFKKDCGGQSEGCASHEIMVWLKAVGKSRPSGETTNKFVKLGSYDFEVWKGSVGGISVISLVPKDIDKVQYTNFKGDFKKLLQNDLTEFGVDKNEFICTTGAGIEVFKGSGTFLTRRARTHLN